MGGFGNLYKGEKRKLSKGELEKKAKRVSSSQPFVMPAPQVVGKKTKEELRGGS